ncbi:MULTISPECIES: YbfB/YjiJ family MFS transporter [Burkholderia]|jgi:MFS family permease|uniref:YbfB/YjiJ family MFS transporter n=15 Tax=Burkholderia TaxID=32008 RepID=A0A250LDC7_9BURK|nr:MULTISPECIES: YbfB/YjiJ family MFS transporter [Burkholderia]UTP20984.1 YbfB/YjiJ family MFS transporter [Burkholderia sp. FXe9]KKL40339.1 MFS transporter [Burkholderia contaminans LMG 23361]MBA9831483.1 YbfB/YjiJ family MFS transporter [Burkholderia contaminans]MBA9840037.1 YbfB/YjiJ family MFS transporter [Burkholderia contaminans]MBA9863424.1 YbfB/YjiJ family MFS transporter [Burkholderia contaminans]
MSRSDAPTAAAGAPPVDDADRRARAAALACMVGLAVVLGVGRFAFTPLLPLMLADGSIGLKAGGWLASANYAGYFVGAVSCAALRVAPARMVRVGLVATVLLTAAMGIGHLLPVWLAVRFVAGVVSAWTFVFVSQWGLRRLAELHAPAWSGVIYAGPGVGIVVTGLIGSALAGQRAASGWLGFAALSAVLSVVIWRTFVAAPAQAVPPPGGAAPHVAAATAPNHAHARRHRADAAWLVVLYGMPGFGYIITATFLPVIARAALPAGSPWPDLFWPMFGAALIVGAITAARLPAHWDNRLLLAAGCATQALGIAAGIVWPNAAGFSVGSALLGLPFTAITLFAMREARRLHGERAAGLMGYATASYGVGQILGPLVAAPLAARFGSFSPALWVAVAALLLGAAGFAATAARGRRQP